jgi:hypothetical protein
LSALGGTTPYRWKLTSGHLPAGLRLKTTGAISGTPTKAGTAKFTIKVTDASHPQLTTTKSYSLKTKAAI